MGITENVKMGCVEICRPVAIRLPSVVKVSIARMAVALMGVEVPLVLTTAEHRTLVLIISAFIYAINQVIASKTSCAKVVAV